MDSDDDDGIFEKSVFDLSNEVIGKGDLVWAPLSTADDVIMWPAQVTSIKSKDKTTVKMLGRSMKALTVEGCVPYLQHDEYEERAAGSEHWDKALELVRQIMEKETNGIIQDKLPSTPSTSTNEEAGGSRKRRRLTRPKKGTGFVDGDVVWAKYRSHPVWPALVKCSEDNGYVMIEYLEFDEVSIRTALKNVSQFDCPQYDTHIDDGINSSLSQNFKKAYLVAYDKFKIQNPGYELKLVPVSCNGNHHIPKEPVSPHKGKTQLVHFINKNEEMFLKIIQGKLVSHFHKDFKTNTAIVNNGALFGSFAKTELQEERVLDAIAKMQAKFSKRYKLAQAYGLSVMLPEAIIRLIMFKRNLSYSKAMEEYQNDILKVDKRDTLKAKEALLNTPISEEAKEEFNTINNLKIQKTLKNRGKGKRKRK